MKGSIGLLVMALIALALGSAALSLGRMERDVARAEERIVALDYSGVDDVLARAERFYERARLLGRAPLDEVRAERAALRYWQRDYVAMIPQGADPMSKLPPDNTRLQFLVANALFRQAQQQAHDAGSVVQAVDTGIAAQLAVLKSSASHEDAAFNYEYLLRLREVLQRRKGGAASTFEALPEEETLHGKPGAPPQETPMDEFKIHVPLETKELRDHEDEGDEAGKDGPPPRRG
jgi:hypothetical protein